MEAGDDRQLLHGQLLGRLLVRVTGNALYLGGAACSRRQNQWRSAEALSN